MPEYISKEDTIKKIAELQDKATSGLEDVVYYRAIKTIRDMPATDVQPVVHCKDCKHRKERHYEESGEKPYIKYECKFTKYSMSDEGFCSFGTRIDDKQSNKRGG